MMKLVRKHVVITNIKIMPNTKLLKINIIKDNHDSNFEVISDFKWGHLGYKEWEMMLDVLNKNKRESVIELQSTLAKKI